jgi:hypothetical protein
MINISFCNIRLVIINVQDYFIRRNMNYNSNLYNYQQKKLQNFIWSFFKQILEEGVISFSTQHQ